MAMRVNDFATMKAIAKMEKTDFRMHHRDHILNYIFKLIVFGLVLFIVGYIILYQTLYLGNPLWTVGLLMSVVVIEIGNMVVVTSRNSRGRKRVKKK